MNKKQYSFEEFNSSSLLIRSFIDEHTSVAEYTGRFFSEEALVSQCEDKKFTKQQRDLLVSRLEVQNIGTQLSERSKANIANLSDEKTFTITTGHQLNMATGPLYTLYKILEVINWCERLNEKQTEQYFVPVFWMATEDHDFEEINHINLFGSKIDWEHENTENSVVGRIDVKASSSFIEQVLEKFNDDELKQKISEFLAVYSGSDSLASANRTLINNLFGTYGLVIIDGDDSELKKAFLPIAKLEIEEELTFLSVSKTNESLKASGFHNQVFVRESNLFYIEPSGERVRIERNGNVFNIKDQTFSINELVNLLNKFPDRFSPNALLRPIYQESVLPNVSYIGGGGEIAYWLQLKSTFEKMDVKFPLLKVRESILLVDEKVEEQMNDFGYSILELKTNLDDLLKDYVTKNQKIELSLTEQKDALDNLKLIVLEKALLIDKNGTSFIEAEFQKMNNQLDKIEKKFIASEKKNQEKSIKQLKKLQNVFFPNGGFQERHENYLSHIQKPHFIEKIKSELKQRMRAKPEVQVVNV